MCEYEYCERSYEADRLIDRVILRGQEALDEYVGRYVGPKSKRDPAEALMVTEYAAWKLCKHRERYSHACPPMNGDGEEDWCQGCRVAAQIAFASGLLGVLWRERLGADGCSEEPEVRF